MYAKKIGLKAHVIFWLGLYIYSCIIDVLTGDFHGFAWQLLTILTHHMVIVYSIYWALTKSSFKSLKGIFLSVFYIFLSVLAFQFTRYIFVEFIQKNFFNGYVPVTDYYQFFLQGMNWYYYFVIAGVVLFLGEKLAMNERDLRIESEKNLTLQIQQQELEKQRLHFEAAFLRAQINPHFLQNVLNFIYAKSLTTNSPVLSESIITLSEIMRYSMEQPANMDEKTLLENEWHHIKNYLRIHEMRFDNKLNISLNTTEPLPPCRIIPLVLITFVENAFKHGDLRDEASPLKIELLVENNRINFSVKNKVELNPRRNSSSGLGLENTKQRLQWAYKNDFDLQIRNDHKFFEVYLNVPCS